MYKQISATEAAILHNEDQAVLLDVREDSELTICKLDNALHIPMGEIPERHSMLPKDKPVIVFCHHGGRSSNVQQFLVSIGFDNVINMKGGIHAWSSDVDPGMAQY